MATPIHRKSDDRRNTVTKLLFGLFFSLIIFTHTAAQQRVTITGQLVCSECWSEADRKTVPFGTPADVECAINCAEKGIASAIAVKEGDDYKLYLVEQAELKDRRPEWLNHFGQQVEVSGRLYNKNNHSYVAPEKIRYLSESTSAQHPSVVGTEADLSLKDLAGIDQKLSS